MVMSVSINGAENVSNVLLNLPKKMEKEIMIANEEFTLFIQRSAKARAPKDTGLLAKSIIIKKRQRKIEILVDAPYGIYQELGFTPHWVHSSMSTRVGGTIGSRLGRKGFIFVQRFKPFIAPAVSMAISRLPMLMERAIEKAVVKSRK